MSGVAPAKAEDTFPTMYPSGVRSQPILFSTSRLTATDVNAQHNTLTAAQILGGFVVHTSAVGAGNVTTDTALNIIAGCGLVEDGDTAEVYYINDGTQTLTMVAGTGVTIANIALTILTNKGVSLLFRRTSPTAVSVYIVGA